MKSILLILSVVILAVTAFAGETNSVQDVLNPGEFFDPLTRGIYNSNHEMVAHFTEGERRAYPDGLQCVRELSERDGYGSRLMESDGDGMAPYLME